MIFFWLSHDFLMTLSWLYWPCQYFTQELTKEHPIEQFLLEIEEYFKKPNEKILKKWPHGGEQELGIVSLNQVVSDLK